jgi:hypothetical protein
MCWLELALLCLLASATRGEEKWDLRQAEKASEEAVEGRILQRAEKVIDGHQQSKNGLHLNWYLGQAEKASEEAVEGHILQRAEETIDGRQQSKSKGSCFTFPQPTTAKKVAALSVETSQGPHTHTPPLPSPLHGVFILCAHVTTRHQGHALMLTIFGIFKQHPHAFVIVVDNASSPPLKTAIPIQVQSSHKTDLMILRQEVSRYEYGAFTAGLKFLNNAKGPWALDNFDRFVFMQAQIYLNERIGSMTQLPSMREEGKKCEFTTMMTGGGVESLEDGSTEGKMMADYLDRLGLYKQISPNITRSDLGAVHSSHTHTPLVHSHTT